MHEDSGSKLLSFAVRFFIGFLIATGSLACQLTIRTAQAPSMLISRTTSTAYSILINVGQAILPIFLIFIAREPYTQLSTVLGDCLTLSCPSTAIEQIEKLGNNSKKSAVEKYFLSYIFTATQDYLLCQHVKYSDAVSYKYAAVSGSLSSSSITKAIFNSENNALKVGGVFPFLSFLHHF